MTRPARTGSRPIRVRRVVVLPAPLRPISATRPPGGTTRSTSRSTGTPAMSTDTPCSSSMGWFNPNDVAQHGRIFQHDGWRAECGDAALAPDGDTIGEALHHLH